MVFASLHTRDTVGSVYRLLEFGIPISHLEQTLTAVLSQRLVSLVCPHCGNECHPECRIHRKRSRLGIYEILYGRQICEFLTSLRKTPDQPYDPKVKTIEDLIKRGIACGFLPERSYTRWVGSTDPYETLEK